MPFSDKDLARKYSNDDRADQVQYWGDRKPSLRFKHNHVALQLVSICTLPCKVQRLEKAFEVA